MVRLGPFYRTKETRQVVLAKIAASWLIQFLIYVPSNFYDLLTGISMSRMALGNCLPEFMQSRELAAVIFIVSSFVPPLCLGFVYTGVYFALRNKQGMLRANRMSLAHSHSLTTTAHATHAQQPQLSSSAASSSNARRTVSSTTDAGLDVANNNSNNELESTIAVERINMNGTGKPVQHRQLHSTVSTPAERKSLMLLLRPPSTPTAAAAAAATGAQSTVPASLTPTTANSTMYRDRETKKISSASTIMQNHDEPSSISVGREREKSGTAVGGSESQNDSSTISNSGGDSGAGCISTTTLRSPFRRRSPPRTSSHILTTDVASAVLNAGVVVQALQAVPPSSVSAARAGQREMQRLRRAARSMVLLTVIFLMVWMPYGMILCLTLLIQCQSCMTSAATREALKKTFRISLYVMMSDSAINPILYAIAFPAIRQAMIKTFCPRVLCERFGIGVAGRNAQNNNNNNNHNNNNNNNLATSDAALLAPTPSTAPVAGGVLSNGGGGVSPRNERRRLSDDVSQQQPTPSVFKQFP